MRDIRGPRRASNRVADPVLATPPAWCWLALQAVRPLAISLALFGAIAGVAGLGVIVGRGLWGAFAGELDVVSQPRVPVAPILLLVAVAEVIANAVALLKCRQTRRVGSAQALRAGA